MRETDWVFKVALDDDGRITLPLVKARWTARVFVCGSVMLFDGVVFALEIDSISDVRMVTSHVIDGSPVARMRFAISLIEAWAEQAQRHAERWDSELAAQEQRAADTGDI